MCSPVLSSFLQVHHDGEFRRWTFLLYLNDVDAEVPRASHTVEATEPREGQEGEAEYEHVSPSHGETWFPVLGLKIRPTVGDMQFARVRHICITRVCDSRACASTADICTRLV